MKKMNGKDIKDDAFILSDSKIASLLLDVQTELFLRSMHISEIVQDCRILQYSQIFLKKIGRYLDDQIGAKHIIMDSLKPLLRIIIN